MGGGAVFSGEDLVGLEGGGWFSGLHLVVFGGDGGILAESCFECGGGAGDHDLEGFEVLA